MGKNQQKTKSGDKENKLKKVNNGKVTKPKTKVGKDDAQKQNQDEVKHTSEVKTRTTHSSKLTISLMRAAFKRSNVIVGNRQLPVGKTRKYFYAHSRIASAPRVSSIKTYAKACLSKYNKTIHMSEYKNFVQGDQEVETNKDITIGYPAQVKLTEAVDVYMQHIYKHVKLMSCNLTPCLNPKKFTTNHTGLDLCSESQSGMITLTWRTLYTAYKMALSDPNHVGPRNQKTLAQNETIFGVYCKLDKIKGKDKGEYEEKEKSYNRQVKEILENECKSFLYQEEGFNGVMIRYGVERTSSPIFYIMETLARNFVHELLFKSINYLYSTSPSSKSSRSTIDETIVVNSLKSCGFTNTLSLEYLPKKTIKHRKEKETSKPEQPVVNS
jgi:hypothetical protein